MTSLMIHCGAKEVDLDTVLDARTPEPTASHFPIPHGQLIVTLNEQIEALGLQVKRAAHALNNEGQTYFGLYEVGGTWSMPSGRDFGTIIGLRNDHGKRFAAGCVGGERVFVCDNLSFTGEFKFQRKHTRFINRDLPRMVGDAISRIWLSSTDRAAQINRWRRTELNNLQADHLILEAFRRKCFPANRLEKVVQEYRQPSHVEHGRDTVWTLHNAVTEALKGTSLRELPGRTMRLQPVLDSLSLN